MDCKSLLVLLTCLLSVSLAQQSCKNCISVIGEIPGQFEEMVGGGFESCRTAEQITCNEGAECVKIISSMSAMWDNTVYEYKTTLKFCGQETTAEGLCASYENQYNNVETNGLIRSCDVLTSLDEMESAEVEAAVKGKPSSAAALLFSWALLLPILLPILL